MAACAQCGHRTVPGGRWCNQCGTPVPDVSFAVRQPTPYSPPALIDLGTATPSDANRALTDLDVASAPAAIPHIPPQAPDRATPPSAASTATALAVGPPPPPSSPPPPDGRRRPPTPVLIAAAGVVAVVIALIIVVVLTGGDDASADATTGTEGDSGSSTEAAAGADIEVPSTAADGVDVAGSPVSYAAANLIDGDPTTAWRMDGDAAGGELTLSWPAPVTITDVGIVNGYAKVDDANGDERYGQNRRVTAATWIFDDGTEISRSLEETTGMQAFRLDDPVQTSSVTIRIDETSDPGGRDFTAISELSFLGR